MVLHFCRKVDYGRIHNQQPHRFNNALIIGALTFRNSEFQLPTSNPVLLIDCNTNIAQNSNLASTGEYDTVKNHKRKA